MHRQVGDGGTVGKALAILDFVASFERPVRFSELLSQNPYPKATLYRFLQVLTGQNMLTHDPSSGTYSLGVRLVRLAHSAWKNASLAPIAKEYTETLAIETGQAVHLAQFDNGQVIFVDMINLNPRIETLAQVGMVARAYCTGVGKAMHAFMAPERLELVLRHQSFFGHTPNTKKSAKCVKRELKAIREHGVTYDREEHEEGIISIAAPILAESGRIIGAVSIATSTTRQTLTALGESRPVLLRVARKIGEVATNWQFPT